MEFEQVVLQAKVTRELQAPIVTRSKPRNITVFPDHNAADGEEEKDTQRERNQECMLYAQKLET